jgi:hypothetical protein
LTGDYTIVSQPKLPDSIPINGSDTVIVALTPSASGASTSSLQMTTNDDAFNIKSVTFTASVKPVVHVDLRLSQYNTILHAGDTALIDVIPDINWLNKGLQKLSFVLKYNSDLLTYSRTVLTDTQALSILTSTASLPNRQEQLTVDIHAAQPYSVPLRKDLPLVRFYFMTALTDTTQSEVSLSQLQINSDDPIYKKCTLSSQSIDGTFSLQLACGGTFLQKFIEHRGFIIGSAPHPDPAHSGSDIIFSFTVTELGVVHLQVLDDLGREVSSQSDVIAEPGTHQINLFGKDLPSGTFSYVLSFMGKGSESIRGRFVVLQ